jgi:hypothetical protein
MASATVSATASALELAPATVVALAQVLDLA